MLSKKTIELCISVLGDVNIPVKHPNFDSLAKEFGVAMSELKEELTKPDEEQKGRAVARRSKEVARLGWVFTGLIIFEVVYFTTVKPEALSPAFVAILTGLLLTVKAIYGIEGTDDEESTNRSVTGKAKSVARKVSKKVMDSLEDPDSPERNEQDTDSLRSTGGLLSRLNCSTR